MTVELRKPQIGDIIAKYKILSKLGSGGMGDVYLCEDSALDRQVAVKIMHSLDHTDNEIANRFLLEGKSLAKLTHPNIVSVFGLGEENGFLYIAMEHVPGRSLFQLSRERRLSIREMISIFSDIAAGLDHAHSQGIVHRDIKPANILVDNNGRAKIIDFGIAKVIGGGGTGPEGVKTKTGAIIGTLNYIAPELFRGVEPSPSSDIYALGLLFAEMLTGRTPFKGESQFATMELIRDNKLSIPENLQALLPEATWTALQKIIHKDPELRPRTAVQAAKLLEAIEFPNLPSYFNSELVSVRIENVDELQEMLEVAEVDQAEWQFVLALAVRNQMTNGSKESSDDATRLIERTGVFIPGKLLQSSLKAYRRDFESILTMKRAEALSTLTPPPPVAQITPHTASVDVQAMAVGMKTGVYIPAPNPPPQIAESTSTGGKWVAAAVIAALIGGGVYYQNQKAKEAGLEAQAAAAKDTGDGRRKRGAAVAAPAVAAPASPGAGASGFAMVVEPSTDAWPPIALENPAPGTVSTWKWKVRSTKSGESTFVERRTFESDDEGLLKFKVERLKRAPAGGGAIAETAGTEWYAPGFAALPRKTLQSQIFGSVGGAAVGQPGAVFPLRKGKEVQFELNFKSTEPVSWTPLVPLSSGFSTNYRSSCSVRDKVKLTLASGPQELVKVDCYTKSDTDEVSDVMYYSADKALALRHDRRVNSTLGGVVIETSMSGEVVENVANVQPAVRNPAQNK